jgi:hypothetical protein
MSIVNATIMQNLMDTVITGMMRKSLISSSFLLGIIFQEVLRILAAGRKFSRKRFIRSSYGTAAEYGFHIHWQFS